MVLIFVLENCLCDELSQVCAALFSDYLGKLVIVEHNIETTFTTLCLSRVHNATKAFISMNNCRISVATFLIIIFSAISDL